MELGIDYQLAESLVKEFISEPFTKLHSRESEEIMRAVARYLNEDEEKWGIIGLLHDIDWDLTKDNPVKHGIESQRILKEAGATEFLIQSIVSHCYENETIPELKDFKRTTRLEHCLVASETLTGLIVASALVQPEKKLSVLTLESLKKKFKNKGFAAKCNRDLILECEKADIPLDEFLRIGLTALQGIANELGL